MLLVSKVQVRSARKINSRSLIQSPDGHDGIGIKLKGDFDLRNALGCGRDTGQVEFAEEMVELCLSALAFKDFDRHGGLVVRSGREAAGWCKQRTL